jgi:DNA repair photolyase
MMWARRMGVHYVPHAAKTALQRVQGMPFAWSLNPYRGCRHACIYCYARVTHTYLGYEDPADFDRLVLYKEELPKVLAAELARRRTSLPGVVAIGTATDPYQPLEARERLTRRCLEILLRHGAAVTVTTKSPLVLRDLDLLQAFAAYGGIRVHITVTVLDDALWRLLEPHTPAPAGRLRTLARLAAAGIPCSVFVAPVVPQLTEQEAERVLVAAAAAGADHAVVAPLRLGPGVGAWFFARLAQDAPEHAAHLRRLYGDRPWAPSLVQEAMLAKLAEVRRQVGLADEVPPPRRRVCQPTLFPRPASGEELAATMEAE